MKAAFYTETGIASDVLRIGELPTPEPGIGEVRVKLKFSGVNPSDVKSRGGTVARSAGLPLVIPHSDGAGVIDKVGEGVSTDRLGERVWVFNGQWNRQHGTAAEFIVLPAQQAVPLPAATSFEEGACLGIPALTAWVAVHHANCSTHTRVLVQGGAGAVGRYAIQFARLRGAFVLATVSSEEKAAYAKSAGADQVINYRTEDVAAQVKALTEDHGVDAVIEVNFFHEPAAGSRCACARRQDRRVWRANRFGDVTAAPLARAQRHIAIHARLRHCASLARAGYRFVDPTPGAG